MKMHHYCNTIACPECVKRFYKWAENHTRGKPKGSGPAFYEAAAKFRDIDNRATRKERG